MKKFLHNTKRKKILGVVAILIFGWLLFCLGGVLDQPDSHINSQQTQQASTRPATPPTAGEMLALVNTERAKYGVAPLREDPRLDASAQYKASDMQLNGYFDHTSPISGRKNGLDFMTQIVGSDCSYVAENLNKNIDQYNTSAVSVMKWTASTTHHETMIDAKYTLTGFGVSGNYVVEHFCQEK